MSIFDNIAQYIFNHGRTVNKDDYLIMIDNATFIAKDILENGDAYGT